MTPPDAALPATAPSGPSWAGGTRFSARAVVLILALGLLLYGYTLNFPFVFDDCIYLVDNPLMRDFRSFFWRGDFTAFANYSKGLGLDPDLSTNMILRPVTYFTFYLNYLVDGMNPRGFRAVNIVIHCGNAVLVFFTLAQILRTSRKRGELSPGSRAFIALSAALLFLVHPLQIESVTYVVQRFTSLGTLFYLATVLTFLRANHAEDGRAARRWRVLSVASLVVGMLSKEILFTAPFMLLLLDWLVMGTPLKTAGCRALPYVCCLPLLPALILCTSWAQHNGHASLSAAVNITNGAGYPPYHYALTQLSVVLTYLRLLLCPRGLNVDWDYPLTTSLLDTPAFESALLIVGILGGLVYGYRRRGQEVRHALLCYAVLWFFMTVAMDSSLIPLPDLLAEHRSYLPSMGILCALACGADLLRTALRDQRRFRYVIPALMVAWILALATATGVRQQAWHTRIGFWEDAVAKSPHKFRPWFNLGVVCFEHGQSQRAIACIRKAIALWPECFVSYRNLACVENALGHHREALAALQTGVRLAPDDAEQHFEMGKTYAGLGDLPRSELAFKQAAFLRPAHRPTHLALAALYCKTQRLDQAWEQMKIADSLAPLEASQRELAEHIAQRVLQQRGNAP